MHLVMDFDPKIAYADIIRGLSPCSLPPATEAERPAFGEEQLECVRSLSALASPLNFEHLADLLGSVHFERHVSCEECWDWLAMIGAATGESTLIERAESMKRAFLGPWT